MHLYEHLLYFQLQEKLASAAVAGINFTVTARLKGLQIQVSAPNSQRLYCVRVHWKLISFVQQVSGFNQKLGSIVDRITKEMQSLFDEVDEHKMQTAIDGYKEGLDMEGGSATVDRLISTLVCARYVSKFAIKEQLRQMRLDDLRTFCRDLWMQMKVIALIQGNMTEETAQSIMQTTLTNVDCAKIEDVSSSGPTWIRVVHNNVFLFLGSRIQ